MAKLRKEELFVKDALVAVLGESATWKEGEDPPDFYLTFNRTTVAVEVTRLTPITYSNDGTTANRYSQDVPILRITDELEEEFHEQVGPERTLLLSIDAPIKDLGRFKKDLSQKILELLHANTPVSKDWKILNINGETVKIKEFGPRATGSNKRIISIVSNKNSNADIAVNVEDLLKDRILKKEKICSKKNVSKPRWLALLNNFWLADNEMYDHAMKILKLSHSFDRVYLVSEQGQAHRLL